LSAGASRRVGRSTGRPAPTAASPEFVDRLRRRGEPDGFVPFDRFMEVALYDRDVGYYARQRSPLGPAGDYYTASRVPIFSRTLASRVTEVREALGSPRPFYLVDLGSGDGALAASTVRALGDRGADLEVVVVDRSASRRVESFDAVDRATREAGGSARSAPSLAELGPVQGVVVAHELLDALPVRRFLWSGSGWRELGFRIEDGRLAPSDRAPAAPPSATDPPLGADDAGLLVEDCPGASAVVREVADHLVNGLLIVVDYGDEERALRLAHPRGTLAAVRAHRPVGSPTESPGEVDLSAFVNFTAVRASAAAAGLAEVAYRSQAAALEAWGFSRELERALRACSTSEQEVRLRLAAKTVVFGFESFRVLELAPPTSVARLRRVSEASRAGPS